MSGFFDQLQTTIESKSHPPTIVNEESKFVVVTYWWGRGRANANIARPCMMFYEDFIDGVKKITMEFIRKLITNPKIINKDDDFVAQTMSSLLTIYSAPLDKKMNEFAKNYYYMIHTDVGTIDIKPEAARMAATQARLLEMREAGQVPDEFTLPLLPADKISMFLNSIAYTIISLTINEMIELSKVNRAMIEQKNMYIETKNSSDIEENRIKYAAIQREQDKLTTQATKINDTIKNILKRKTTISLRYEESDTSSTNPMGIVSFDNVNIYDLLIARLRFRKAKPFENMISEWEEACKAAQCNHLAIEYPEFAAEGGYQMAINAKPLFIRHALAQCGGRAVLYIDGDMIIHRYPGIFDLPNVDFMARGWNADPRAGYSSADSIYYDPYRFETSGGIMFFASSRESRALIDIWISESSVDRNKGKADDRILSLMFNARKFMLNMNIIQLPIEYLWLTLDYDERLIEQIYDWDRREMRDTIIVEHAECLTSEETASGSGSSSNRSPKFHAFLDNMEGSEPVSERFDESLAFPSKVAADEIRTYLKYMSDQPYINDGSTELIKRGFIDPQNPENNEYPLYVTPYDKGYGNRRNAVAHRNLTTVMDELDDNYWSRKGTEFLNNKVGGDVIVLCEKHMTDTLGTEYIIPMIMSLLERNERVIVLPRVCVAGTCYMDILTRSEAMPHLDMMFFPDMRPQQQNPMTHMLKPKIDLTQPIYFHKMGKDSLIVQVLSMFGSLGELADELHGGSYQILSRVRIGYAMKRTGAADSVSMCTMTGLATAIGGDRSAATGPTAVTGPGADGGARRGGRRGGGKAQIVDLEREMEGYLHGQEEMYGKNRTGMASKGGRVRGRERGARRLSTRRKRANARRQTNKRTRTRPGRRRRRTTKHTRRRTKKQRGPIRSMRRQKKK